ncbi:MAG: ABC transporter ATP-binding protein [Chloroflexi bacterium]|nr:ABC transporter ATP-binding protein [Chloroflexota bacterium]
MSEVSQNHYLVDVHNVIKNFQGPAGTIHVLKSVNLKVHGGEFVGVRGPSGSGKSTLINMITGIDRPTSGAVRVAGEHIEKMSENQLARFRGKHIGVIFQFFQLLPTLTVLENVILPMDFCRVWKPKERPERAMMLLDQVGLADQAHKLPNTLSGGQQQRAAIARALANDPPLLMADEPTGNLDSKTADKVFTLFEDLIKQGKTFIMVTHDVELAKRIPRVIEVYDGILYEGGEVLQ